MSVRFLLFVYSCFNFVAQSTSGPKLNQWKAYLVQAWPWDQTWYSFRWCTLHKLAVFRPRCGLSLWKIEHIHYCSLLHCLFYRIWRLWPQLTCWSRRMTCELFMDMERPCLISSFWAHFGMDCYFSNSESYVNFYRKLWFCQLKYTQSNICEKTGWHQKEISDVGRVRWHPGKTGKRNTQFLWGNNISSYKTGDIPRVYRERGRVKDPAEIQR